jgi:predicted nucleic acid-binding protein
MADHRVSPDVWELAVRLVDRGRAAGVTAPLADLLVFACAKHYALDLAHDDAHFTQLDELDERG